MKAQLNAFPYDQEQDNISTLLFNTVLEVLASTKSKIGKKKKNLSLFVDVMIFYVEIWWIYKYVTRANK